MEVSRRNFLVGAGVAAGALATAGLVGCSSESSESLDSEGLSSADTSTGSGDGGRWSWSKAPDPVTDIAETYDCEICIVGLGIAGCSALYYADKKGADVMALQKLETMHNGGNGYAAFNTSDGKDYDLDWDMPALVQKITDSSNGKTNVKLVHRTMSETGPVAEWFAANTPDVELGYVVIDGDHLGTEWTLNNFESDRSGMGGLLEYCTKLAEDDGVQILYSTPAVQLVTDDDGNVTGVIGEAEDGSYVQVNTSKGVILCTGGIEHDKEMLECYYPFGIGLDYNNPYECCTGDGTKMGMWIGAAVELTPANSQIHLDREPSASFKGCPWLHVNINGERFMNENQPYENICNEVRRQPEHRCYQIIDSHLMEHVADYERAFHPTTDDTYPDTAVESGSAFKADTIEELAEQIDIDPDVLQETVDRYNEMVDNGVDEDFCVDPEILQWSGIKDAPFYAFYYENALLCTDAGLTCNENLEVLNEDGEVIKGLYAAGNTQGTFFGYDYPAHFGGFSVGRAATGGVLAVQSAMGTLGEDL